MKSSLEKAKEIIQGYDGPPLRIMEVCGTHTHEIFHQGVRSLLPSNIDLISGPGCPVCVTPIDYIDEAIYLSSEKGVTITTFGDLVRVPGTTSSLRLERAKGKNIRVVYSPSDASDYAKAHPDEEVVFLSIGFETTTPSSLIAVKKAMDESIDNFSILTANKTMPSAYRAMARAADFYLYPGHVHAITGTVLLEELAMEGISGVCAGFTGLEILTALAVGIRESQKGVPFFINAYPRVVKREGSPSAVKMMNDMMDECDAQWRGLGVIPDSGLKLKEKYRKFDARYKFDMPEIKGRPNPACRCGDVLQGIITPPMCKVFGTVCTPEHPVGSCMVSSEGACSAWYLYGREVL